jgi:hypothetical protein
MDRDPYSAPQSAVADVVPDPSKQRRPLLVWIITIVFGVSAVWTLLSFALISSGVIPLAPPARAYYDRLTVVDYALTIGVTALNLWGIVLLFLLRAKAVRVFVASVALALLINLYQLAIKGLAPALGAAGSIGMAVGFLLWCAILLYAFRLKAAGVLR